MHVYHSGNKRVMKTVSIIHNLIQKDMQYVHDNDFNEDIEHHVNGDEELFEIDDHIDNRLHFLYDPKNKGTYFSTWGPESDDSKKTKRMQDFLNLDIVSSDTGIAPSPREMAQRLFSLVLEQINAVISTPYHTRENFINGTHEPVLMSGIFYMLNYLKFGKPDFVEHIGGSVDFTEGFHINIYQRRNGEHILQFVFRDYMLDFTVADIENFIHE